MTDPVLEYRVKRLEETVHGDHEPRLRALEGMAAKVAAYAALGSFVGGAAVVALVNTFFT